MPATSFRERRCILFRNGTLRDSPQPADQAGDKKEAGAARGTPGEGGRREVSSCAAPGLRKQARLRFQLDSDRLEGFVAQILTPASFLHRSVRVPYQRAGWVRRSCQSRRAMLNPNKPIDPRHQIVGSCPAI